MDPRACPEDSSHPQCAREGLAPGHAACATAHQISGLPFFPPATSPRSSLAAEPLPSNLLRPFWSERPGAWECRGCVLCARQSAGGSVELFHFRDKQRGGLGGPFAFVAESQLEMKGDILLHRYLALCLRPECSGKCLLISSSRRVGEPSTTSY
jgi:hypothetical protein